MDSEIKDAALSRINGPWFHVSTSQYLLLCFSNVVLFLVSNTNIVSLN